MMAVTSTLSFILLLVASVLVTVTSFRPSANRVTSRQMSSSLSMGFMDMMNKAMANDPSLPPPVNPGLSCHDLIPNDFQRMICDFRNISNMPDPVEVQFLPSGKKVKAYLGQNIGMIAKAANVEIKYSCKKGECGTCTVNFNGQLVKACQSNLPTSSSIKKFQIGVPSKLVK